jgi:hypothetical protein
MFADKKHNQSRPMELGEFSELKAPLLKPLRTSVSLPDNVYSFANTRARELFRGSLTQYLAALIRRDIIAARKGKKHVTTKLGNR